MDPFLFKHLAYTLDWNYLYIVAILSETIDESETSHEISVSRNRNLQGIKEFCGRCTAIPLVKLAEETYSPPDFPPKLGWYKFKSQRDFSGSVLAAFELIEVRDATLDRYSYRAPETEAIRA